MNMPNDSRLLEPLAAAVTVAAEEPVEKQPLVPPREPVAARGRTDAEAFGAGGVLFTRAWSMPFANTFDAPPIAGFVHKFLVRSAVSVDAFARNKQWATHTNDLNPNTAARHHLDVLDFLRLLRAERVRADLVIFDPPYSPRQLKECYQGIGRPVTKQETQRPCGWSAERRLIDSILQPGGVVLSFGWSSNGMGKGYVLQELLLCAHGGGHNDTICIAERKVASQSDFFTGGGGGLETVATEPAAAGGQGILEREARGNAKMRSGHE